MSSTIKLLVMDVDGTLTDGKINMGQSGELFKSFDIKIVQARWTPFLSRHGTPR
jgi:3-deoxy-D-manno-octulosonate 8-phosphate phosphatase (KDO 8-P phosphatase)